jgi:hypothetical protein
MTDRLNILVLHKMGDPKFWRKAVRDLEFMLPTYAPEHNYIVHAGDLPLPEFVKEIKFHGIVLGPTFLYTRSNPKAFEIALEDYDFIRTSDAFKIALPQDDYYCSALLDRWMVDWNIDLVYTVCPEHWDVLYPRYLEQCGSIRPGFTGYVSEEMICKWQTPKAFERRTIDVSYRSHTKHRNYGRLGFTKAYIGEIFRSKVHGSGLVLDISTKNSDMIPGTKWYDFVENSRFCLASISGSSLLDREGKIKSKVNAYVESHPKATFEQVERYCFPGEDGKYIFTAISPRNIEAALAGTVQIATPGNYNGIFEAGEHYIRLEPDGSNISDVLQMMRDISGVSSIAKRSKEAILAVDTLRFKNHVSNLIRQIGDGVSTKKTRGTSEESMARFITRYRNEVNRP